MKRIPLGRYSVSKSTVTSEDGVFWHNRKPKGSIDALYTFLSLFMMNKHISLIYYENFIIFWFAISVRPLSTYVNTPSGNERKFLLKIPSSSITRHNFFEIFAVHFGITANQREV